MANPIRVIKSPLTKISAQEVSMPSFNYAELADFNEICISAMERIEEFGAAGMVQKTKRKFYSAMLSKVRAAVSESVVDHLRLLEMEKQAQAERRRIKLERRLIK